MPKATSRRKRILWVGVAVVAALLILVLLRPKEPVVQTARAFRGDLTLDLSTTGVVEGNVADVSPKIVGKITAILVDEGDRVRQGQVVALLDTSELQADVSGAQASLSASQAQVSRAVQSLVAETRQVNAQIARARAAVAASRARLADLQAGSRPEEIREAQAAVEQASAQAENAQADLRRAEKLFSSGAISAQQLDAARTSARVAASDVNAARQRLAIARQGARSQQIAAARAEVQSAEAALSEAQAGRDLLNVRREEVRAARAQAAQAQAALQAAQARISEAQIVSPATGTVVRKQSEVGETVGPQQPVLTISRTGPIWVAAEVDQEDVAAVADGQQVTISLDAYPGRDATGIVSEVSTVAVPKEVGRVRAKVVRARINIIRSALPLKPGMEVDIDGKLRAARNVLLVPNDAVVRIGDKDVVYTINSGTAHRREIVAGLSNFDFTSVKSGLREGQTVAVSNLDALTGGSRVRVSEAPK